jgi:uncharacterized protein (TIGR03083 family)
MARTTFEYGAVRDGALAQLDRLATIAADLPADVIDAPTRLTGWSVGVLVAHIAASFRSLADRLAEPEPARPEHTLLSYYAAGRGVAASVDERAQAAAAGSSPDQLRGSLRAAHTELAAALRTVAADRVVTTRLGSIALVDALTSRCVEGVVHGLDLAAALDRPAHEVLEPAALRVVVKAAGGLLQERAPGRSVEVRLPGSAGAAFQCVEGPRHTRGTPGNVVEADVVTFVELAAGRLAWAEAVEAGRVRASGERADLSAYLPLVG